ncbi:MAG: helix-turn-helix domain-containing protein, partial [Enhydrobacter sp.]|nr:helix-turn-helix domain-containing protein [Enhydrobacter sp.]
RSVTLAMPSAAYEGELASASMRDAPGDAGAIPQLQVSGLDSARLHDVISAIEALAARDPGLWLDGQWIANAERALLEAFLRPLGSPASIELGSSDRLRDSGIIVREVEARLDADPTSIPSISALCESLRISRRSLERAFHDLLGVSPAHHLRLRSLNAVREALLRCRPEPGIITRTALDNGFWHLGRFSLSYRALFGERPIDTLRRGSPGGRSPRARSPHSAGEPPLL